MRNRREERADDLVEGAYLPTDDEPCHRAFLTCNPLTDRRSRVDLSAKVTDAGCKRVDHALVAAFEGAQ